METVTKEQVRKILANSEFETFHRIFGKQCVVVAKLPNGFTVTGTSAVVDPKRYDKIIGQQMAVKRIEEKIWELEGYLLQSK